MNVLTEAELTYLEIHAKYNPPAIEASQVLSLVEEVKHLRQQLAAVPPDTSVEELVNENQQYSEEVDSLNEQVERLRCEASKVTAKILSFPTPRGRPSA